MKNSALFFIILAGILGIGLYVLLYLFTNLSFYLMWLLALGAATFFLFGVDKLQAILGNWRIPEKVLLLLILAGGAVGGWLGMIVFWHKIRKPLFGLVLIVSTVIQLAVSRWF